MDETVGVLGAQEHFDAKRLLVEVATDFNLLGRLMYKIYSQHRRQRHLRYLCAVHRLVRKLLTSTADWSAANLEKAVALGRKAGEALREIAAMGHWLPFCLACLGVLAKFHKHFSSLLADSKSPNFTKKISQIKTAIGSGNNNNLMLDTSEPVARSEVVVDDLGMGEVVSRDDLELGTAISRKKVENLAEEILRQELEEEVPDADLFVIDTAGESSEPAPETETDQGIETVIESETARESEKESEVLILPPESDVQESVSAVTLDEESAQVRAQPKRLSEHARAFLMQRSSPLGRVRSVSAQFREQAGRNTRRRAKSESSSQ
eukprot:gene241-325_t